MYIPNKYKNKWKQEQIDEIYRIESECNELTKETLSSFVLEKGKVDLKGIIFENNFRNIKKIKGVRFHYSHFKDLSFKDTVFENVDLSQCEFSNCYLRRTKFINCRFIGTSFIDCNLIKADFSNSIIQYAKIRNCYVSKRTFDNVESDSIRKKDKYYNLRELYTQLKANCYSIGDYDKGNYYKEKELTAFYKYKFYDNKKVNAILSWIIIKISGYGYKPLNVIFFSMTSIILFSFLYLLIGFRNSEGMIYKLSLTLNPEKWMDLNEILFVWLKALYFSTVTFTTLGYGDFSPLEGVINYILSPLEALLGAFTIALYVVVLGNKYFKG